MFETFLTHLSLIAYIMLTQERKKTYVILNVVSMPKPEGLVKVAFRARFQN